MDKTIFASILGMGGLGFLFATVLALASEKLKIKEDPRILEIEESLPGVNCGACGFLSCHEYAAALSQGKTGADKCRAGGEEVRKNLSNILGVEIKKGATKKAVVHCAQNLSVRKKKAEYSGIKTCAAKNITKGADLLCEYGCLGEGDCGNACPFGAIEMADGLPRVDFKKCVACGKCITACPRNIISLEEADEEKKIIYVACSSLDIGADTRKSCSVGCIACRICEKLSDGAFAVKNNLSIPDYEKLKTVEKKDNIMVKCPTKVIRKAVIASERSERNNL